MKSLCVCLTQQQTHTVPCNGHLQVNLVVKRWDCAAINDMTYHAVHDLVLSSSTDLLLNSHRTQGFVHQSLPAIQNGDGKRWDDAAVSVPCDVCAVCGLYSCTEWRLISTRLSTPTVLIMTTQNSSLTRTSTELDSRSHRHTVDLLQ